MYLLYFLVCVFGIAILFKVFKIQLVEGGEWTKRSENEKYSFRTIAAARGNIYSDDGSLLATSVPTYKVHVDLNTEAITEKIWREKGDSLVKACADLFAKNTTENAQLNHLYAKRFKTARREGKRYTKIHSKVRYDQLQKIKQFPILRKGRYKGGLIIEQKNRREKPFGMLAFRTIGYEREEVAPVGLEGAYSTDLGGQDGKRLMKKISGGVWMPMNDGNEIEPLDGADIVTNININFQDVTEKSLLDNLIKHNAHHGCAVLMEVETGRIKAIANLARKGLANYFEDYNYAVGESTEPGSTFKLMSLMALIDHGHIAMTDSVDCGNGKHDFYGVPMHDSKKGGYQMQTVSGTFANSSNIGMAKLISQYYSKDQRRFTDKLHLMGVGSKLGLEISGEGSPVLKNAGESNWSGISITQMAIGYELQMTPLQQLAFYNAVANQGRLMRPIFVKEVRKNGKVIRSVDPVVLKESICSRETNEQLKQCLSEVVEYGTGENLKIKRFSFAGKTGTARIAKGLKGYVQIGEGHNNYSYQASFVGYFPAENPRYSCIVVISGPSNGQYYGAQVAGPVFKEIAEKVYAASLDMQEGLNQPNLAIGQLPASGNGNQKKLQRVFSDLDVQMNIRNPEAEYVQTKMGDNEINLLALDTGGHLPRVVGMGLADAIYLLENKGKKVKVMGFGTVKKQYTHPEKPNVIVLELS